MHAWEVAFLAWHLPKLGRVCPITGGSSGAAPCGLTRSVQVLRASCRVWDARPTMPQNGCMCVFWGVFWCVCVCMCVCACVLAPPPKTNPRLCIAQSAITGHACACVHVCMAVLLSRVPDAVLCSSGPEQCGLHTRPPLCDSGPLKRGCTCVVADCWPCLRLLVTPSGSACGWLVVLVRCVLPCRPTANVVSVAACMPVVVGARTGCSASGPCRQQPLQPFAATRM